VRVASHGHRAAEEGHGDEQVAGDLFGPARSVVQDVAREDLVEDDESEYPEYCKDDPVSQP